MTPTLPIRLRRLIQGVCLLLVLAPGLGTAESKPVRRPAPAPVLKPVVKPVLKPILKPAHVPVQALPMRLSPDVVPQAYTLALTLDPAQPQHSGTVEIDLQLRKPTTRLRLHAKDLQVPQAWLEQGARRLDATVRRLDAENIALDFASPLALGPARLALRFTGTLQDKAVYGLFRQQEAGRWYALTQFEPVGARLAFPVFDEPGWKVPWTLTLTVPQALTAVANMPVLSETPAHAGWKAVRFATSPPLPSYLLAFGVGEFDVLAAGSTGPTSQTPLRFITPAGRSGDAAYAARVTGPVVERLEAYFGLPHPYPKLDSLVIPVTVNFGAMENAGLVTYASTLMLASPAEQTPRFERNLVATAAHELAHQWFGNLVTMAWWDDIWLNESFASWLGDRITAELMPGWGWDTSVLASRAQAMRTDRLVSSRRIAEPVRNADELANVWDSITYEKGQVVLAMFEQWLGPDRFQSGVRRYMGRHAWGHATADDFAAALAVEDASVPAALRSFTHQPGIPRVAVELLCGEGPPRLRLSQSRLLALGPAAASGQPAAAPTGSSASMPATAMPAAALPAASWQVPMLIRSPAGTTRLLLDSAGATLALPDAECPAWVQANTGGLGYYRAAYPPPLMAALMARPDLPVAERLAGLDDARGLSEAGDLSAAAMLALAEAQAAHADRRVVEQALVLLRAGRPLVDATQPDQVAAYAARWQRAVGDRGRALGWQPLAADTDDSRLLRADLVPALADLGDDTVLRTEARALTERWLADPSTLDAASRGAVLRSAALDGNADLFDALQAALARSSSRTERRDLLAALGAFRSAALADRARALLLDASLDLRESQWPVMAAQNADPLLRDGLLQFVQTHHAALAARLGPDEPAWLPGYFNRACSTGDAARIDAVLAPHAARYPGGQRVLAQTLEAVRLCAAWRAHQPVAD